MDRLLKLARFLQGGAQVSIGRPEIRVDCQRVVKCLDRLIIATGHIQCDRHVVMHVRIFLRQDAGRFCELSSRLIVGARFVQQ